MNESWEIVSSGPLVALKWRAEARTNLGSLNVPPKLFVIYHDERLDMVKIEETTWEIASALAPEKLIPLTNEIRKVRDAQVERDASAELSEDAA